MARMVNALRRRQALPPTPHLCRGANGPRLP